MTGRRSVVAAIVAAWCLWGAPLASQSTAGAGLSQVPGRYTGAVGDFDFQGADLRLVLRAVAEIGGLNLVIDSTVDGVVDLRLMRVPWDQAFDVILKSHRLGSVIEGTVVRIVPLDMLAAEEAARQKLADSLAPAQLLIRTFMLNYARAAELEPLLRTSVLSRYGSIQHDVRTNTLIVRDVPDQLSAADELVRTLDRPEPQVSIEARIVQTNRDSARALGIQWGGRGRLAPEVGNTTGWIFPNTVSVGGRADENGTAVNLPAAAPTSAVGLALGAINGAFNLDVTLSALERSGNGRILSSPTVTTQNNKPAEMTQGVQIPVQTVQNNTVTVEFRDAALRLLVTPRITAANTVLMDVELENATPDFSRQVNNVPPIDTQRARTSVQVSDGATTIIGGIMVSREQSTQDRTPVFHKIPLLGWLFKRDARQDESRELIIFITPRIIRSPL